MSEETGILMETTPWGTKELRQTEPDDKYKKFWEVIFYKALYIPNGNTAEKVMWCRSERDALALVMKWNAADPRWKYWM